MPSLGLSLGPGGVRVLGAAGPTYDPDAAEWFEAVEATGATFGPDSATVDANKTAWSNWVIAQKNAESPIEGRSNWQQLTQADEGFIQPLMGVSTFNIPALFGASEFINFVVGDYDPATGLRGGDGRRITSDKNWNNTPLNDVSAAVILTGPPTDTDSVGRIIGGQTSGFPEGIVNDGRIRSRDVSGGNTISLFEISTPRTLVLSRHVENEFRGFNGGIYVFSDSSVVAANEPVVFLNNQIRDRESDARIGLATYGRSIDVEAMNTACVALSEAIVWH